MASSLFSTNQRSSMRPISSAVAAKNIIQQASSLDRRTIRCSLARSTIEHSGSGLTMLFLVRAMALARMLVVPVEAREPGEARRLVHEIFQHRRVVVVLVLGHLQQRPLGAEFPVLPDVALQLVDRARAARVDVDARLPPSGVGLEVLVQALAPDVRIIGKLAHEARRIELVAPVDAALG